MAEADSNINLTQTQDAAPQPILTPATVALTPKWSEPEPAEVSESAPAAPKKKKLFLLLTIATVLLAGIITAVVFVSKNASSKKESSERKAPEKVSSLEMVTDEQISDMNSQAETVFSKKLKIENPETIDKINIDAFHNVGMLYMETYRSGEVNSSAVEMVYQIQVTDNTGTEPVKRQFFWGIEFEVPADGSSAKKPTELMLPSLVFDKWGTNACLDAEMITRIAKQRRSIRENTIDKNLYLPFEGQDPSEFEPHKLVNSTDQVTDAMLNLVKPVVEQFLEPFSKSFPDKMTFESADYFGLMVLASPDRSENIVVVLYKVGYLDETTEKPEHKTLYWYMFFDSKFYEGGQVDPYTISSDRDSEDARDWVYDPNTTYQSLRSRLRNITSGMSGWDYSDNFPEENA